MLAININSFQGVTFLSEVKYCLFVSFDSLRPINNISVIKGRVFLRRTMEGKKRHYSMHTSLFLYVGNFILFCKLCHYIM